LPHRTKTTKGVLAVLLLIIRVGEEPEQKPEGYQARMTRTLGREGNPTGNPNRLPAGFAALYYVYF
jgi:hypothetical protein